VAWVEKVKPNGDFLVSQWNWGRKINDCWVTDKFSKTTTKWFNKNNKKLLGFIYVK